MTIRVDLVRLNDERGPGDGTMSATRERIASEIRRSPGIHFRGLVRSLELAPGQVQYHVRRLRAEGRIVDEGFAGRTHFFDPSIAQQERRQLAILRRETARDIVVHLIETGPTTPAATASSLEIARSTLEFHLERLTAASVLEKSYDADGRVTLRIVGPDRVAHLLTTVQPGLPERLTDRFTRLVDHLISE